MRKLFEESGLFESVPEERGLEKIFDRPSGNPFEERPWPFVTKNGFNAYIMGSLFPSEMILMVNRTNGPELKKIFPEGVLGRESMLSYFDFPNSSKSISVILSEIKEETEFWNRTIDEMKSLGVGFPLVFRNSSNDFLFQFQRKIVEEVKILRGMAYYCSDGKYIKTFIGRKDFPTLKDCLMDLMNGMGGYSFEIFAGMPPRFRDWLIGN